MLKLSDEKTLQMSLDFDTAPVPSCQGRADIVQSAKVIDFAVAMDATRHKAQNNVLSRLLQEANKLRW